VAGDPAEGAGEPGRSFEGIAAPILAAYRPGRKVLPAGRDVVRVQGAP
jgi:hypothetical protein